MKKKGVLTILCLFLMMLLSSCDHDVAVVGYEFGVFPRIVYIANVDTELDFSDVTINFIFRNGNRYEEPLTPQWLEALPIEHSIDFTTPGVYKVRIVFDGREHIPLTFLVQVIDEEIFNQLSGRTAE